jgi:hypothetical protein
MGVEDHFIDVVGGRFAETDRAQLDALFDALLASGKDAVIHFHGGLVSRSDAIAKMEALLPHYEAAGAYPIFFIWNSDLGTTIRANLDEIMHEEIFRRLLRRIAQFALSKILDVGDGRGVGEEGGRLELRSLKREVPKDPDRLRESLTALTGERREISELSNVQVDQLLEEIESDDTIRDEAAKIAAGVMTPEEIDRAMSSRGAGAVSAASTRTLISPTVVKEIARQQDGGDRSVFAAATIARYGLKALKGVISRYMKGRDHGVYTTCVEEILRALYLDNVGTVAWKMIKQDTADAFGEDGDLHAGTAFVELLRDRWPSGRRITLVGHSTGAIYIGHLLEAADAELSAEQLFDVVFLAPACTFPFMSERLELFQRRAPRARVFNLSDELESGYWEVPGLYDASLLYLVSGLFEEEEVDMPILGMQRFFTGEAPFDAPAVQAVRNYLEGELVWSEVDEVDGRRSGAKTHGAFDRDERTLSSLSHLLEQGL